AFNQHFQRIDHTAWLAIVDFPRQLITWNIQAGNGKAGQTSLGARTNTSCTLVTDFATRTSCSTWKRRNAGRVVMGFNFHQDMYRLLMGAIFTTGCIREETAGAKAFNYR